MHIDPLPEGTQPLVPYMVIQNCAKAMEFYKKVFLAEEVMRLKSPNGKMVMHAEMKVAGCMLYLADEMPEMGHLSPRSMGGTPVSMVLYCADADKVFNRAIKAGAHSERPMADQFYGCRAGTLTDPFGHRWTLMTRTEKLSEREIQQRAKKMMTAKA